MLEIRIFASQDASRHRTPCIADASRSPARSPLQGACYVHLDLDHSRRDRRPRAVRHHRSTTASSPCGSGSTRPSPTSTCSCSQRHDLIPNLVETVKGYAAHERGTLEAVVQARNAAMAAQGPAQQAAAENVLTGALRQLFALSEAYPDLKANENFQQLQMRAHRHREQDRRGAPLLQQRGAGIQYRHPAVPGRAVRRLARLPPRSSSSTSAASARRSARHRR